MSQRSLREPMPRRSLPPRSIGSFEPTGAMVDNLQDAPRFYKSPLLRVGRFGPLVHDQLKRIRASTELGGSSARAIAAWARA
jgi:hypothetical protein